VGRGKFGGTHKGDEVVELHLEPSRGVRRFEVAVQGRFVTRGADKVQKLERQDIARLLCFSEFLIRFTSIETATLWNIVSTFNEERLFLRRLPGSSSSWLAVIDATRMAWVGDWLGIVSPLHYARG
jgi:hypothetical protein